MIEKDFVNIDNFLSEGIVKWSSPSNIALVKYWGKKIIKYPKILQLVLRFLSH